MNIDDTGSASTWPRAGPTPTRRPGCRPAPWRSCIVVATPRPVRAGAATLAAAGRPSLRCWSWARAGHRPALGRRRAASSARRAATVPAAATDPGIEAVLDDLDQNFEFYVWLASRDADLLAME